MTDPTSGLAEGNELAYSFRPSLLGAPRSFLLSGNMLVWDVGRHSGRIPLERITRIRLSYRPVNMQSQRFVTEIWTPGTPKLDIVSSSWKSMFEQIRLDSEYRAFTTELHRRLAAVKAGTVFTAGVNPLFFWAGLLVFAAAAVGLIGLIVRAIQANALGGAFLVAVFLALFIWQAGNFFRRNRPGRYQPEALPPELMPRGD